MLKHTIFTVGLACLALPALATEWLTDITEAKSEAANSGKAILVNFTGSDWCGYCIRMRQDVLDKPEFATYAEDKFVLLEVDLPRHLMPKDREERIKLCREYSVTSFPTFLVLNAAGEVLGGFTGGRPDVGSTAVLLDDALERGHQLAIAREHDGTERAKALFEIYKNFPANFKGPREALQQEIATYDPDDTLGIRETLSADKQMQELMAEVRAYHRNYQKQTEIFERYLANAHPLNRDRIMERKRSVVIFPSLNVMLLNAQSVDDIIKARDYVLREAEISYPDDIKAEMIDSLKSTFADPEAMLRTVQERRSGRK
ncbi:MAG: thioredoxin family protein [Akkermansia sp.]|nr:thioredoxin family protein [Akkermansia sp.]